MYQDRQFKTLRQKLRNSVPDAERKLWKYLRNSQIMGYKFTRQYGVGRFVLDFYCPALRLGIELDGGQHLTLENLKYDAARTEFLKTQNINIVRFYDNDVMKNIEGVIERIIQTISTIN